MSNRFAILNGYWLNAVWWVYSRQLFEAGLNTDRGRGGFRNFSAGGIFKKTFENFVDFFQILLLTKLRGQSTKKTLFCPKRLHCFFGHFLENFEKSGFFGFPLKLENMGANTEWRKATTRWHHLVNHQKSYFLTP